jgi:hypothetical protein
MIAGGRRGAIVSPASLPAGGFLMPPEVAASEVDKWNYPFWAVEIVRLGHK